VYLCICATDPVDATRELTLGHKECVTVLIGISIRGVATAGVVHVPFINPRTVGAVCLFVCQSVTVHLYTCALHPTSTMYTCE
jgi:3'-phosphoadenosine 5'-phosphosulfate (PAPS) 3'-phosphatase